MPRIALGFAAAAVLSGCGPTDYESCVESKVMSAKTDVAARVAHNLCDEKFLAPKRAAEAEAQKQQAKKQAELNRPKPNYFDQFDTPAAPVVKKGVSKQDYDVNDARAAGYSDAEIANYLGMLSSFDVAAARTAGYSDTQIIAHLTGSATGAQGTPVAPVKKGDKYFTEVTGFVPLDQAKPSNDGSGEKPWERNWGAASGK